MSNNTPHRETTAPNAQTVNSVALSRLNKADFKKIGRKRRTLDSMLKNQTHGCKAEKKKVGLHFEYRIFQLDRTISSSELIEKLTPIIEGLRAEGKKNMVTMSPQTVAVLAHRLQKLLDEWAE